MYILNFGKTQIQRIGIMLYGIKNYNLESVLPENRSTIICQLWNDFDNYNF